MVEVDGKGNLEAFEDCLTLSKHKIVFNGEILNKKDFQAISERFPEIDRWMLGRGVLANPFLPSVLKGLPQIADEEKLNVLKEFHDEIYYLYRDKLSGNIQILSKVKPFWEYLSKTFDESHKVHKLIKKASNIDKYETATNQIFRGKFKLKG